MGEQLMGKQLVAQRGGKEIGTLLELTRAYTKAFIYIFFVGHDEQVFPTALEKLDFYRAVRHCYDGDSDVVETFDGMLNRKMDSYGRVFESISRV